MKHVYIRRSPSRQETAAAGALAVGLGAAVGALAYYLTRMLLARDVTPLLPEPDEETSDGEVEGPG
ncbi:MAG: hypothetical protein ACR2QM_16105 [Longimicrobiales bacterium]